VPTDARLSALSSALRLATPSARGLVEILRAPHVARLATASFVARLPRGMAALAIVLLVHDATGSYAAAGAAGAALSIGDAGVSPLQGRLVDRRGPARVLVPSAIVYAVALTTLALLGAHLSTVPAVVLAGAAGAAFPPVSASMKMLWPRLAGGERLVFAAYAVESLIQQSLFLLGPLLIAGLVVVGSHRLALMATAALGLGGTLAFVASPVTRTWEASPGRRGRSLAPRGAVRALVAITLVQSVALGGRTVAIPAFAARHGHPDAAGVLLAVLNLGALVGVPFGAGTRAAGDPVARYRLFSILLAASAAPLVLAVTVQQAALLLALAGLFIAPTAAASYVLMDRVSDPRGRTEAFAWMSTAVAGGTAIGAAAAGITTEARGVTAALALTCVAVAGAALATVALSGTLGRPVRR
jgi:MFS family permease